MPGSRTSRPPATSSICVCREHAAAGSGRYGWAVPSDSDDLDLGRALLGAALRERRELTGLSRRQVSQMSGVGYDSLFSIENGRRLPNLGTLHRLAQVFETTPRDLLRGVYPWDDVPKPLQ